MSHLILNIEALRRILKLSLRNCVITAKLQILSITLTNDTPHLKTNNLFEAKNFSIFEKSKMNLFRAFFLAVILHNSCMANSLTSTTKLSQQTPSSVVENPKQTLKGSNKRIIRFEDLYYDLYYLIFLNLNLQDLLSFCEIRPMFASVSYAIFYRRYRDYEVSISKSISGERIKLSDAMRRIEICEFDTIISMLKHFGWAFKTLEIQNIDIERNKSAIVNEFISNYTADSLKHLKLDSVKEDTLQTFKPFQSLEEITIEVGMHGLQNGNISLNQLFPNLRCLRLYLRFEIDNSFIDSDLPHLQFLFLAITFYRQKENDPIERLIRRNPQVKTIEIDHVSPNLAKIINEVTNLTQLKVYSFDVGNDSLCFEHVNQLKLYNYYPKSLGQVFFRRLELLEIQYSPKLYDSWLQFFKNHTYLQRLQLEVFYKEDNARLVDLVNGLPHLIELEISCFNLIGADVIQQIVDSHKKLAKLELHAQDFIEGDFEKFKEHFGNEWHIHEFDCGKKGILFEIIQKNSR